MRRLVIVLIALAVILPVASNAAEVKIFRSDTREAVLEGTLEGVSVDALGGVELAPGVERLTAIEEPFVFTAAGHPDGWVVGTGNSGKALLIDAQGEVTELAAVAEPEVFAVHADPDGTVFLGSSPHGKVYRVAGGEVEEVFAPGEGYIWALARDREGRLLVATGLGGRVYRLGAGESGKPEVILESRDHHVRSLAVLADGSVLAGTAGQGLILRVAADGEVTTVHDAVQPEVLAFTEAPDGTVYAAVLASEASQVDLSGQRPAPPSKAKDGESAGEATVVVVTQGEATIGSRSAGAGGPRSAVLEISGGRARQLLELEDETVHSLLWHDGGLWIGTGQDGRLYRWADGRRTQERVFEEQQLAALAGGGAGVAVATTNAAAIYRLGAGREPEGTYTSKILDAGQVARFGSFLWRGRLPRDADIELAFRSGMSSQPDDTWTAWDCAGCAAAAVCRDRDAGCRGWRQEVSLGELAHGRYVQWRAVLKGGKATPRLEAAELTYRQENLRPEIKQLEVLDPGQILVPQSFSSTTQTFEPWSPDRQGIFTSLRPESKQNGSTKTLWKKGYQTLRWSVEDANEDPLHYRLDFRSAAAGDGTDGWLPVVKELEDDYYSFDAVALPDGVYRFRLTASDRPAQAEADALAEEKLSEPVVIDHTPPVLVSAERRDGAVEVEVRDAFSPLRDAVVSIDAGKWQPAAAADGLLDGRRETIRVAVPAGARMVLLRLTDAHWNVVTFNLLEGGP